MIVSTKYLAVLLIAVGIVYSIAIILLLNEENFRFLLSLGAIVYLVQTSFFLSLLYHHRSLPIKTKSQWLGYILLIPHVSLVHFLIKYKEDLNLITHRVKMEMKSQPDSLEEFNRGSTD